MRCCSSRIRPRPIPLSSLVVGASSFQCRCRQALRGLRICSRTPELLQRLNIPMRPLAVFSILAALVVAPLQASAWGAIASNGDVSFTAVDYASEAEANDVALKGCAARGQHCELTLTSRSTKGTLAAPLLFPESRPKRTPKPERDARRSARTAGLSVHFGTAVPTGLPWRYRRTPEASRMTMGLARMRRKMRSRDAKAVPAPRAPAGLSKASRRPSGATLRSPPRPP
jgi:hypothetical protein